jgi:hypothetical protein
MTEIGEKGRDMDLGFGVEQMGILIKENGDQENQKALVYMNPAMVTRMRVNLNNP